MAVLFKFPPAPAGFYRQLSGIGIQ